MASLAAGVVQARRYPGLAGCGVRWSGRRLSVAWRRCWRRGCCGGGRAVVLAEQNAVLGRANRFLAQRCGCGWRWGSARQRP